MEPKAIIFEFKSYKFEPDQKRVFFNYTTHFSNGEKIDFSETVILPKAIDFNKVDHKILDRILQNTHLAIGISYYKLYCPKKVQLKWHLSKEEADFWNSFYGKGLGEFLYRNQLDPKIVAKFPFVKNKTTDFFRLEKNSKFLVGLGGGKDSIVSVELFKKYGADFSAIFIETQKESHLVDNVVQKIEVGCIKIKRQLDEKLFDKTADFYKGHIPISGIYAFLGILAAASYGYGAFLVSNEFSSNFGNTRYKGKTINHQWSKSYEFEKLFQEFLANFISPDLNYFSLMRPFYEIRIMEIFSKYDKYFSSFSSCNSNFRIDGQNQEGKLWCGKCAKCMFSFLILSPFLPKEKLIEIFGSNLFQDIEMMPILRDILGFGRVKPFDCVGTFDEAKAAFYMSREKFRDDLAGEIFLPKIDPEDNRYFFYNKNITLKMYFKGKVKPLELIKKVFKTQDSAVPDYLRFLGVDNAFILGHGKEGQVSERYLKTHFPDLKIGIGDILTDPDYLSKQSDYDIAIKTPGIPKNLVKIPYTTATNIFFSYVKNLPNIKIVGVTGTKGKSTTASLIYHILKKAGKNAELLGNIGTPMLESIIDKKLNGETIFVIELSSYQLDDIQYSPDISVITSLFPEHMDYHSGIKNYYSAKKNILKFQTKDDFCVYNQKNRKIVSWVKSSKAKSIPFVREILVPQEEIKLFGNHNKDNIGAAVSVAEILGIPENIIKSAIKTFEGLPHRLEFVGEHKGIKFFDDAISTTPESTIFAIKSLSKIGTIFLGGQDRGYKFSQLEKVIKKHKIKNIVLFPESGKNIFKKGRKNLNIFETSSMDEAVKFAYKFTQPGEVCLLSCASPSYSLWKNFEEKGDQFKLAVKSNEKDS